MKTMAPPFPKRVLMNWIAFALLLVVSGANIFVMVHVLPLFPQIYHDLLGSESLPSTTSFVLHWSLLFDSLAFIWPMIGVFIVCLTGNNNAMRFVLGLILAAFLQTGFTTIALFEPLITDIGKLQSTK